MALAVKNLPVPAGDMTHGFDLWVGKILSFLKNKIYRGRFMREWIYELIYLFHFVGQQKLAHCCNAIILQ